MLFTVDRVGMLIILQSLKGNFYQDLMLCCKDLEIPLVEEFLCMNSRCNNCCNLYIQMFGKGKTEHQKAKDSLIAEAQVTSSSLNKTIL